MSASQASQRIGQVAGHLNYPKGMLAGQVAIITGSGQGIGAEAARLFANEGAKVVVSDIDGRMIRLEISQYEQWLRLYRKGRGSCQEDQGEWRSSYSGCWRHAERSIHY